jgi:signal transduction histidine kinase
MDLSSLLAALEYLILERLPDGRFARRGDLPWWCASLPSDVVPASTAFVLDDVFPFLAAFLDEAQRAWLDTGGAPACSELWSQVGATGEEVHLQALALRVEGKDLLVVTRSDRLFEQRQLVLQRARELRLTHTAFLREIEKKDILIHAIVHDLAAPLHGILGAVSLLSEMHFGEPAAQWIRVALKAAMRQRQLIGEILDVFTSEQGAFSAEAGESPQDAGQIVRQVVSEFTPAAERQGLRLEASIGTIPCLVVGEETRLFRVLSNLIENALRYSPRGSVIHVTAQREGGAVCMSVEDDGPGVPPEVLPRLFEKFARGQARSGTGLGLYFCRITIERWGGAIGYEARPQGGARFWLRLPATNGGASRG